VHGLTSEVGACENATAQVFVFEPQGGWILAWGQARVAVYAWGGKLVVSAWEHAQVNVYAIATDVEVYKNDEAQVSVFR